MSGSPGFTGHSHTLDESGYCDECGHTMTAKEFLQRIDALQAENEALVKVRDAAQAWADARFHGRHELPLVKALLTALSESSR